MLKRQLQGLKANAWAFEDPDIYRPMMAHIGTPDPHLRDKLIYKGLCALVAGSYLSEARIGDLLDLSIQGMTQELGRRGDDVFRRSFSTLIAAEIVEKDTQSRCLCDDHLAALHNAMLRYAKEERDFRGYDPVMVPSSR